MTFFEIEGTEHPELAALIKHAIKEEALTKRRIKALFVLKPGKELPDIPMSRPVPTISREEYAKLYATRAKDMERVKDFAGKHGLLVTNEDPVRHVMEITGTATLFSNALKTKLAYIRGPSGPTLVHEKSLKVPEPLRDIVEWIFGLNQLDIVEQSHGVLEPPPTTKPQSPFQLPPASDRTFTVERLAELYQFPELPAATRGLGQCVGAIQLDGGYRPEDIHAYFKSLGLPPPEIASVGPAPATKLSKNAISNYQVTQGIEIIGAIAPRARQVIYCRHDAASTLDQYYRAFLDAIHDAVNRPSVITNSWGFPENVPGLGATSQQIFVFEKLFKRAAHLGVTIVSATGSSGSLYCLATAIGEYERATSIPATSVPVANYPASSPYNLACGGTELIADPKSGPIKREMVWNGLSHLFNVNGYLTNAGATGGGVSRVLPRPAYQRAAKVPAAESASWTNGELKLGDPFVGRGLPDVAADADVLTGYRLYFNGAWGTGGGTGVTAPLWAGLIALINQGLGHPVGFVNPALYKLKIRDRSRGLRSINEGTNGAFHAQADDPWNPCCGLGSPRGKRLLAALRKWYRQPLAKVAKQPAAPRSRPAEPAR